MRRLPILVCLVLVGACGAVKGGTESVSTLSGRLLAGQPMTACTLKGEYPVQAETDGLCGTLRVPEDRSNPDGRQVELQVAVVLATAPDHQSEPFFVLAGGPGDVATQFFAWLPAVYEDVHNAHEIVLIDQRGTGDSNGHWLDPIPDTTGLSEGDADRQLSNWANESLQAVDADPRFYTSTVAADDIDSVRAALGYDTINLYGTSYGGTLAQYYMRQYPDRVRAAVLDGATPLDVPVFEVMAPNSQAALDLLLSRCARDEKCHEAFPQINDELNAVVDRLSTPVTVVDPQSGAKASLDMGDLADAIHSALLTEATAVQIPLAIHLAYQGNWLGAAQIIGRPPADDRTLLMSDEILCSEAWARFDPTETARLGAASYALDKQISDARRRADMCRFLPEGVVPSGDGEPLLTNTPVLWIAGDGDPQDPPANLAGVPQQQPGSRIVVMPAQEHVVGHLGCMPTLIARFLASGRADNLDASCATNAPPLSVPFRLS